MDFTLSGSDTALFPLLHFVLDDLPTSTKAPELDDSNMRDIISGRNIKSNNMRQMMPLYLGYLCSSKFIEFPAKHNLPILDIWANAADNVVTRSGS
jgi:L-aminoadipate-semialdehyde dehydrogenase